MPNEFIGRLDEIGLGKESTAGTAEAVGKWVPKGAGAYTPVIETDFFPGNSGTIDAVHKGAVTQTATEITIAGSPTDTTFGHFLHALFGTSYSCVKFPIPGSITGTFVEGETVTESTSTATGTLRRLDSGGSSKALYVV